VITISAPELNLRLSNMFQTVGCSQPVSARVADSLVEANLAGHDSHGAIRVPGYIRMIQAGRLNPHAEIQVVKESASTAMVDCGNAMGQTAAMQGMHLAMDKARQHDIASVVLYHCGHVGRLGEYVVAAAEQGFVGIMLCNGPGAGGGVAPFGGIGRALGTNPISWGVPGPPEAPGVEGRPVFLDYATSACAQGKIQVAADMGREIPEGWLIDKNGQPTRNPLDQFDGGVMLPFAGHKGYAMSVLVELLAGGLSGARPGLLRDKEMDQGTLLIALHIEAFQPLDEFRQMVGDFLQRVKATPLAPGCAEILAPGEPEWRSRAERMRTGIPVPEKTWERLAETAASLGMAWDLAGA
jgi:LDH2 family malate/lactate/ureidoglycolate dehydrogenase